MRKMSAACDYETSSRPFLAVAYLNHSTPRCTVPLLPHNPTCYNMASTSSKFPEYYVLLGVERTASTEEIRSAYKRESLRCVCVACYPASAQPLMLLFALKNPPGPAAESNSSREASSHGTIPGTLRSVALGGRNFNCSHSRISLEPGCRRCLLRSERSRPTTRI